jgi:hypothetical protein
MRCSSWSRFLEVLFDLLLRARRLWRIVEDSLAIDEADLAFRHDAG